MRAVQVNLGGLLAWEFLLMHWVEVRRWQDYKNFGSVNEVRCNRANAFRRPWLPKSWATPVGLCDKGEQSALRLVTHGDPKPCMLAWQGYLGADLMRASR